MTHTPGPWFVNPVNAWVEIPGEDAPICSMLWPTESRSEDETYANAKLIAAAPELLTALEDFDNWFCGFDPDDQASRMEGRKVVIRARAAIAKAQS